LDRVFNNFCFLKLRIRPKLGINLISALSLYSINTTQKSSHLSGHFANRITEANKNRWLAWPIAGGVQDPATERQKFSLSRIFTDKNKAHFINSIGQIISTFYSIFNFLPNPPCYRLRSVGCFFFGRMKK